MESDNKKLQFQIDRDLHARFRIALYYDRMTQSYLLKKIIEGYLANNIHLRNFIDEVLAEKLSAAKKRNRARDRREEKKTIDEFALNKEEVENIFDLIERENPDL
jgi:hypothetical protein